MLAASLSPAPRPRAVPRARAAAAVALSALAACRSEPPAAIPAAAQSASAQATAAPAAPAPPAMRVPKLDGASLVLDGLLDEDVWRRASTTGPLVDVSNGQPNKRFPVDGTVRLFWDDTWLYVGFDVEDRDLRGAFPADAVDPHLWTRDTVELMLDPDGDGDNRDYYEIQIGPQGLVFDSHFDGYNAPRGGPNGPFGHEDWSSRVERGVKLRGTLEQPGDRDEGYTVEARIPWAALSAAKSAPPRSGDTWRVNFYAMQDNGGVAWSPILGQGNFHFAPRFGRITWVIPLKKPASPHPWVEHLRGQVDALLHLFEEDDALRAELYDAPDPLKRRLRVSCNECTKPACCKHRVSVSFLEALALYAWASEHERHLLEVTLARGADIASREWVDDDTWFRRGNYCPFFVEGRCRVYAARPHACRTHYMKGNPSRCARELKPAETYAMDPDPQTLPELERLDADARFFGLVGEWNVDELASALWVIDRLRRRALPSRDPITLDVDSV